MVWSGLELSDKLHECTIAIINVISCYSFILLKSTCPVASAELQVNDTVVLHGTASTDSDPSSSAGNPQQFTVIAAMPSTGIVLCDQWLTCFGK